MARKSEFGESWWAKRWISMLESFGWSNRLQRGRSYARYGHVLDVVVAPGEVRAKVRGSRPRPYKVTIRVKPLDDAEWQRVTSAMAKQAVFAARLLAGEMPENIEEALAQSKVGLFPASSRDIITTCSCPDWANPCKHVAAVYYVLGQEFDRDPFLLFLLRGRSRDELVTALREKRVPVACPGADEPSRDRSDVAAPRPRAVTSPDR
ncbi:MAG: SWIM zinc finger family protein, partial [Anaerolineae bacterium]|nr:SWIM zinc finger family protein [Anaerolineae bacterium]